MQKLICFLFGHKWRKLLFTEICVRCKKADVLDEVMDQYIPQWREPK